MGLFTYIRDAVSEPKGPVYTVRDLEEHWREYDKCITNVVDGIDRLVSSKSLGSIVKAHDGKEGTGSLCSRIRFRHLRAIRGWMDDEFIPKLRRFTKPYSMRKGDSGPCWCRHRASVSGHPRCDIRNNAMAAKERSGHVLAALHFFLCDTRSTFEQRRSMQDEGFTESSAQMWYVDGKRSVKANMDSIDDAIERIVRREGL